MCDYSLSGVPNRLAEAGDELEIHFFRTWCMGLAATADVKEFRARPDLVPAVCVPPGARIRLGGIPEEMQREYRIGEIEEVEFLQTSMKANCHRDAVKFQSGLVLKLQRFSAKVRATVLSLGDGPAEREAVAEVFSGV